jgi:thioesterase domain-containing protein
LVTLRHEGDQRPLFCVPGAGANTSQLHALARHLDDRPVHVFVPKGVDRRALPDSSIARAARRHVRVLRAAHRDGPYDLLGYSFGGLVALEMARQLAGDVRTLVLLDPAFAKRPLPRRRIDLHEQRLRLDVWRAWGDLPKLETALFRWALHEVRRHRPGPHDGTALLVQSSPVASAVFVDGGLLTGEVHVVNAGNAHHAVIREPGVAIVAQAIKDKLN